MPSHWAAFEERTLTRGRGKTGVLKEYNSTRDCGDNAELIVSWGLKKDQGFCKLTL